MTYNVNYCLNNYAMIFLQTDNNDCIIIAHTEVCVLCKKKGMIVMKKRMMATLMALMLVFGSCMCVTAAPATQTTTVSAEEFTLLVLTEDMVDAGMYAESGTIELVLTLFTLEKDQYVCLMMFDNTDNSADLLCGLVTDTNTIVDNKKSVVTFTDVVDIYTGDTFSLTVDEGTKPYIQDPTGTKYNATLLTEEETITYMATILALEE